MTCKVEGTHADHSAWADGAVVVWPNESYVPPPPRETRARQSQARDRFLAAARNVAPETRTSVDANAVVIAHNAPATAVAAAEVEMPRSGTHRRTVYDAYCEAWPGGLTEDELVERTGLHINTARPRRWELVQQGRVEDSGQVRLTHQGNDSIVWRLTEIGAGEYGLAWVPPGSSPTPAESATYVMRDFG